MSMTRESRGTRNSHYVPQFILRHFGTTVSCYNVRTGQYLPDRNPYEVYSEMGYYPDDIEKDMNEKMESEFAILLMKKVLDRDEVRLTRKELWTVKRFLLMSMIRTPGTLKAITSMRDEHRKLNASRPDELRNLMGDFYDEVSSDESDEEYWIRSMRYILDDRRCNLGTIDRENGATYMVWKWAKILNDGYIGFWDAGGTDKFMLTDIGMTSETEVGADDGVTEWRKWRTAVAWHEAFDETTKNRTAYLLGCLCMSQENFYMFPISADRMIVVINQFFKHLLNISDVGVQVPDLSFYTVLDDRRLFESNRGGGSFEKGFQEDDVFIYKPVPLEPQEVSYCNALLMDRVQEWLGFPTLESARKSILMYRDMTGPWARNDFQGLYEIAGIGGCVQR